MNLEELGYSDSFEAGRKQSGLDAFSVARVIAEHRGSYRIIGMNGERTAKVTGKKIFRASSREDYPAVGDWVAITELNDEQAVIEGILPRKSVLRRKQVGGPESQVIAANVDAAFVVQAIGRDFSINRLERYSVMIIAGGVEPSIILNKSDLVPLPELDSMVSRIRDRLPDTGITSTSVLAEGGLDNLKALLERGKTYCFVGSSGVGKSSIINKLLGRELLETRDIGAKSNRGKHVTTARELFMLDGGAMVIDNPGMRELGVLDAVTGIGEVFDDIVELAKSCKFPDCTHANEQGCAVRSAIESGTLDEERYESYDKLRKEDEFHDMTNLEKRRKDRAFGKFIKKAKEGIEKYK